MVRYVEKAIETPPDSPSKSYASNISLPLEGDDLSLPRWLTHWRLRRALSAKVCALPPFTPLTVTTQTLTI